MQRFNLSAWAITHRALILFMMIVLAGAGIYSYLNLGRAEDPSFTIKVMIVNVSWPGATAAEMEKQVADKIEKKLQELPHLDRVESYSRPGVSFIRIILSDTTPPSQVKELWYQVRKKVGDIRNDLPPDIQGPNFNDEFGDVYSALYMLTGDGQSYADLKARAEDIRQRLLRVPEREQGRHHRRAAAADLHRVQPRQARESRHHAAADLRQRRQAECRDLGRGDRYVRRSHQSARDRRFLGRRSHCRGAGAGRRPHFPARRYRHREAGLRRSVELSSCAATAGRRSASACRCSRAPTSSRSAKTSSRR